MGGDALDTIAGTGGNILDRIQAAAAQNPRTAGFAAPGQFPTPGKFARAGGEAVRALDNFGAGLLAANSPVPDAALGFIESVRNDRAPSIEQIEAIAEFDEQNPGVLSEPERNVLSFYERQSLEVGS